MHSEELHTHTRIPQQIVPRMCCPHRVLWCRAASPLGNARLSRTRTFPGLAELEAQLSSPRKGVQNHTKSTVNQSLKLCGVRRGGTQNRARGAPSLLHSQKSSQPGQLSALGFRQPRTTCTASAQRPAILATEFCGKCVGTSRNKQPVARLGQSHMQSPALPPPVPGAPSQGQSQFPAWQTPSQTHAVLGRGNSSAHCFCCLTWGVSNEATSKEWRREEFCQTEG